MISMALVYNISLLITLTIFREALLRIFPKRGTLYSLLSGLLFGFVTMVGMMTPLKFLPGIIFDGRSIVLGVAGLFDGPLVAVIAALMAATLRVSQGGQGTVMGLTVISYSVLMGVLWYFWRKRSPLANRPGSFYLFGLLVHLGMVFLMVTLPGKSFSAVLKGVALPVMIIYPLVTLLLAIFFEGGESRIRSEAFLAESERQYRSAIEHLYEAFYRTDLKGNLVMVSPSMANLLGYTDSEHLLGMPTVLFWKEPKKREDFLNLLQKKGSVEEYEITLVRKDGAVFPVAASGHYYRDASGKIAGIEGILRNITEKKRAEEKLYLDTERFRLLVQVLQHPAETVQDLLDYALNKAIEMTGSRVGYIYYYNEEKREFTLNSWSKGVCEECFVANPRRVEPLEPTGLWGEAVRQRKPIVVNDFDSSPNPFMKGLPEGHVHIRRFLTVPIFDHERIVAVVGIADKEEEYGQRDVFQLTLLMDSIWKVVDRKRAEEALRKSEEKYRLIANNMTDVITIMDLNLKFTYISPSIERVRGFTVDEAMAQSLEEILTPDSFVIMMRVMEEEMKRDAAGGSDPDRAISLELEEYKKDGSTIWLENRASFLRDEGEKATGIIVLTRDVSDKRRAEKALRESEKVLRLLAESTSTGIFIYQEEKFIYLNPAVVTITGFSEEELMGGCFWDFVHPEDRETVKWRGLSRLEGKEVLTRYEFRVLTKDGRERWVDFTATVIDYKGKPAGLGTIYDVTERKRIEEERIEMERKLFHVQKLESLGVLAGGIAHDFNNLLTAVLGYTELSIGGIPPESVAHRYLQEIKKAGSRAADLARQVLAYSGRGRFLIERISIETLLKEMSGLLGASISKKTPLIVEVEEGLPQVEGDITQIRQVLMNLVINASEAITGENGEIHLSAKGVTVPREEGTSVERAVLLEVSDNGCGMSQETLSRIFEPFFTTKFTGRGLGMSAVQGIVRSHRGTINIESTLGVGTRVKILLPALLETVDEKKAEGEPVREEKNLKAKILLVDDEETVLTVGGELLRSLGMEVDVALSGEEAIELFKKETFDLVILDLTMPRMDGVETLRRLREIDHEVRVIMTSGYTEQEVFSRLVGRNRTDFLPKPFSLNELSRAIDNVLREGENPPPISLPSPGAEGE